MFLKGIVLPFWILLYRNCLRQLALMQAYQFLFFHPEARSSVWTYRRDFRERAYWLDVSFVSSQLTLFSLPLSSWQIFGFYLITIDFTQVISDSVTTDGGRSQDNTGGDRTILLHAVIELIDFHWLLVILLVITSQTSNTLSLPICPKINISFFIWSKAWLVCNHLLQFYQLAVHLSLR